MRGRRRKPWVWVGIWFGSAFAAGFLGMAGCAPADDGPSELSASDIAAGALCKLCVTNDDCGGAGVCAQFGGDSFCAPLCQHGSCGNGLSCTTVRTIEGVETSTCVPDGNACGPSLAATTGVDGSAASTSPGVDAGPARIGSDGGTVSSLVFGVIGDTRPPVINDTTAYPSQVITKIFDDVETSSSHPPFVVATGDYLFAKPNGSEAAPQLDLYLQARAHYSGLVFPAMGNHECTGATASNCGHGNPDGVTNNYSAFLSKLLQPIGKTSPNYTIDINASDGSWTSKFVFVAGNAWQSADATWLDGELSRPTTYTFIVRHEPKAASQAPGCAASEQIMARHPYTLAIVGHTHTYGRTGPRQVTIGNGGAPLTGSANYGYGLVTRRADGAIQVDMIDMNSGAADPSFRFALKADGSPAP